MRLTFLGAADTVTGSRTLVEAGGARILLDCGLFQGLKRNRLRNRAPLGVDPASIDAVVLTHAHVDHSGYVPALVKQGFGGTVYVTPPTQALCGVLLPDSGRLHEEDARYANRKGFSRHHPALPLYTEEDAEVALEQLSPVEPGHTLKIGGAEVGFQLAGHILGAASVRIRAAGRSVLFSGDLGRPHDLLMPPPHDPGAPDFVVVESTYGNRLHAREDPVARVASSLVRALDRGGSLLVPSFAVGRAQALLYVLHLAFERGLAPRVPIFVDSPMAINATQIFRRFPDYHVLSPDLCEQVFSPVTYVRRAEASKALCQRQESGRVVISASGMATGGRVIHHLKRMAPDPRNLILLPGFQAAGTRGAALAAGARTVKIHGQQVPVNAEVETLDLLSAHADQGELLDWLARCEAPPRRIFVNHGEPEAADALRREIQERLPSRVEVPEHRGSVALS